MTRSSQPPGAPVTCPAAPPKRTAKIHPSRRLGHVRGQLLYLRQAIDRNAARIAAYESTLSWDDIICCPTCMSESAMPRVHEKLRRERDELVRYRAKLGLTKGADAWMKYGIAP